jgi:hypothetical protein
MTAALVPPSGAIRRLIAQTQCQPRLAGKGAVCSGGAGALGLLGRASLARAGEDVYVNAAMTEIPPPK